MSKFSVELYSDGIQGPYGNEYDLNIDDALNTLIYYDTFSEKYTANELYNYLNDMDTGYQLFGTRWAEFKLTKR